MWGKMMAGHPSNKLTALAVKKQTTPGRYSDGNGLYLVVDPSGAKRWLQRLSIQGKRCDLGLGSTRLVSLDDAREQALINRRVARAGGDPIAERNHEMGMQFLFAGTKKNDPTKLHTVIKFESAEAMQAFSADKELIETRRQAGAVIESGVMTPISDDFFTNNPDAFMQH